jgi:uncharacterized protein (TIGR02001 family)
MKLSKISALCFAATTMMVSTTAVVAEESAWTTSGNVALSSEYMWRGQDLSGSDPAISGGFDIGHASGFYVGTWASNIEADDGSIEIDYYAGYAGEFGESGVGYDVGFLYYDFPGIDDFDYAEVYGFLSYSIFSAGVSYSLDVFDADYDGAEDNVYYQLDASYDVGPVTLAAGIGHYDYDDNDVWGLEDYENYYIGASTEYAGFGFDLTWHDVDSDGDDNGFDDTIVFTISKSL